MTILWYSVALTVLSVNNTHCKAARSKSGLGQEETVNVKLFFLRRKYSKAKRCVWKALENGCSKSTETKRLLAFYSQPYNPYCPGKVDQERIDSMYRPLNCIIKYLVQVSYCCNDPSETKYFIKFAEGLKQTNLKKHYNLLIRIWFCSFMKKGSGGNSICAGKMRQRSWNLDCVFMILFVSDWFAFSS